MSVHVHPLSLLKTLLVFYAKTKELHVHVLVTCTCTRTGVQVCLWWTKTIKKTIISTHQIHLISLSVVQTKDQCPYQ